MILDGKALALSIHQDIRKRVTTLTNKPGLAVVLVGDDPASHIYVAHKEKACNELGFYSEKHVLPISAAQEELLALIRSLNSSPKIHAILVQLPLPAHLDSFAVIAAIDPCKDVDGFHPKNLGNLVAGNEVLAPCTPGGIIRLIESTHEAIGGKHAVVIGRSMIVGRPIALMLLNRSATVTICHSKTTNLQGHTLQADILVAAVGKPCFVTADMVKKGARVIDVGMNRHNGKLVGDVDFEHVAEKCSWITPVPGGVGPMTIAMLMENTLRCYDYQHGSQQRNKSN